MQCETLFYEVKGHEQINNVTDFILGLMNTLKEQQIYDKGDTVFKHTG